MKMKDKVAIFILSFLAIGLLNSPAVYAWWLTRKRPAPKAAIEAQKKTTQARVQARKRGYEYIKEHDLNGDGKVTSADRLMWLNKRNGKYQKVFVSKENEDLMEIMDADNNGAVEPDEMENFYLKYDLNNNGVLENDEINAAAETD